MDKEFKVLKKPQGHIKFIKITNSKNKVYALGVNIGVPWRRDNEYVRNFNKLLKEDIDS